jgi:hypothetical protein
MVFMQSTNTININHSTDYAREVVSQFQTHMARSVLKLLNNETCEDSQPKHLYVLFLKNTPGDALGKL